jgi:hypothetical protein
MTKRWLMISLVLLSATMLCAQRAGQANPKSVAAGNYECWGNGQARMLLNFSVKSATQYVGSDAKPGAYAYDASSGRITFKGGALDGVMPKGFYTIYHEPKGHPTVSFRNSGGSEASFCEKVK